MMSAFRMVFVIFIFPISAIAQQKGLDFFITSAITNSPVLVENTNLQQNFQLQNEIINAQNKKALVSFTADYLFAPFFFDNGKPISITSNPSPKAYGYDVGITNGGLYSAQINAALPIFNTSIINNLYQQNKAQSAVLLNSRRQLEQDLKKNISEQYILAYQYQVQGKYLQKIIDQVKSRKPIIAALIKQGLLQQNDYVSLDIQEINSTNELIQLQFLNRNALSQLRNLTAISDTADFILEDPQIVLKPDPKEYYYQQKFTLDSLTLAADENVFNSRYKPQVNLLASTGLNATLASNIPHNVGLSAGFHVAIPLADGKQKEINQRKNKILLSNLQAYRNSAIIQHQNNLRGAKIQVEQWLQTIELLNKQIEKQELLLEIIKEKVIKGQVTVTDYIIALQDYAVTQKNKAVAQTNVLLYTNQYNYYNW
ncbi:MAG: TolC family protein [Ferruginibacter sp.]